MVTKREIEDAISSFGLLDSTTSTRLPYIPWAKYKNATQFNTFLVTGDRMRKGPFRYGQFEKVFKIIDPDAYSPLKQVRCVRWGSTANDLRDLLVLINGHLGNYLEKLLIVNLLGNEQSGWYLGGNASSPGGSQPYHSGKPHPQWSTHLPNLSHVP